MAIANADIAARFETYADLLEIKGDSPFRVNAYRRAAETVQSLSEGLDVLVQRGQLSGIPGIGPGLAAAIEELVASGHYTALDELLDEIPGTLLTILEVPGVGPKTTGRLYRELGITDLVQLEAAASSGRIRALKGFGPSRERKILQGIAFVNQRTHRYLIGMAYPLAVTLSQQLSERLRATVAVAGSVRRMCETVGNLDLVAATVDAARLQAVVESLPGTSEVIRDGRLVSGLIEPGVSFRIAAEEPTHFGTAIIQWTGSEAYVKHLLGLAGGPLPAAENEEAVFAALGLAWMAPELRENPADLELARHGELPRLIQTADIRGDLHLHSEWSDGHSTIMSLAEAAREKGYEYLSIADHSGGLAVANGLSVERLRQQRSQIDRVNEAVPEVRLLRASEVEVHRDGRLDFPDEVLAELDLVVASLHSGLSQSREDLTRRIVSVLRNPHVDIVAHPTGRIIERRPEASYDWDEVFRVARETGTALEINANPARLDLKDTLARAAREAGVLIVINSDAHDLRSLELMHYGVAVARRARMTAEDVVNTRPLPALLDWLGRP